MGRGGSEATAMWTLQALQEKAELTFTTASPFDLESFNASYGTSVQPESVHFLPAPSLPGIRNGATLAHWQRAFFDRHCRRIGSRFDACISAYNPIDFGRPGLQLIGDLSFSEISRRSLYPNAKDRFCHRQSFLRRAYLRLGDCLRGETAPSLAERGDCAVANSHWNARQLRALFGLEETPVLYPPSLPMRFPSRDQNREERDPLRFVCLGRISPEKEIEKVIGILETVRSQGLSVSLDLIGLPDDNAYGASIVSLVDAHRDWIRMPGFLGPQEKSKIMAKAGFAIHGCRVESFGIAVAEMASAGLIPFVPGEGATREIALLPELIYEDANEAAEKITDLLRRPDHHEAIRKRLIAHTREFAPEAFMMNLVKLVEGFLGLPLNPVPASNLFPHHVEKAQPANY